MTLTCPSDPVKRLKWWKLALAVVVLPPLVFLLWWNGLFSPSLLRVENMGSSDLQDLVLAFPGGFVDFGDVPAGQTSGYRFVFGGVYHYAAYWFTVDGESIHQPVVDWVGEKPYLPGSYVYVVRVDKTRRSYPWLDLLEIR